MSFFTKNGVRYGIASQAQADAFRSSGWKAEEENVASPLSNSPNPQKLRGMTKPQHEKLALLHGIDISGTKNQKERIERIEAFFASGG